MNTPRFIRRILLSSILLSVGLAARAQDTSSLFRNDDERDSIAASDRPLVFNDDSLKALDGTTESTSYGDIHYSYLPNRLTLTGESCSINKLINSVGVGSWTKSLGNILNDDLTDYGEINAVASVGVTVDPIISVRDRSAYYAKGTQAGFCLVSGSGSGSVLDLDVIKALCMGFYRDGVLVGVVPLDQGQSGAGVNLQLINIPGSDEASLYFSATAPGCFDEVVLDFAGGLSVSVGRIFRIKYAFVGSARQFSITENTADGSIPVDGNPSPFQLYKPENEQVTLDYVKGWDPVLLGIPFPFDSKTMGRFTDADLTNNIPLTPIISVGYQGGAKFMMVDEADTQREIYQPGSEVGFVYTFADGLDLKAGTFIKMRLYDRNGNLVQEEDVSAGVLGLSVAGGGASSAAITASVPFSGAELRFHTILGVDLGAILLHYAYVREKPDQRHHCPINPSASTSVCVTQTTFDLHSNPEVSVIWSLVSAPDGSAVTVSDDGHVSGLDFPGEYTFRATAADGCSDDVTLAYDSFPESEIACGTPLTNQDPDDPEYRLITIEDMEGVTGGLLIIDKLENPENVLSTDFNTYASYAGGLELADNLAIVGVRKLNGLMYDATEDDPDSKGRRMGFVVASAVEGVNLTLLNFIQVRCYHEGKEVYRNVIDESNGVSADIGGANKNDKMRYSILVPPTDKDGNPMQVDQIVLWTSGLLSLKGGYLHIYYAFTEEASTICDDPLGCSSQLLSADKTHTTYDFNLMDSGSGIVVANAVNDLDNLIDDDPDSYLSLANTVSAGNGQVFAIKLGRTLDFRHQLGIILDQKTFLAGIGAGSWLTLETYYNGEPTGDVFTDWNVVDADVAGYGDKGIMYIQPKTIYDEVKLTVAEIVGALDIKKFYGIFMRSDIDGDGIPDCQDPESCSNTIADITINDVCQGDDIIIYAHATPDATYTITFSEPGIDDVTCHTEVDGILSVAYTTRRAGRYQMVIYDDDTPPSPIFSDTYLVHPRQTTWKLNASNRDWNKWDNWTNGSPYCCTDVIIPSGAKIYPDLSGALTDGDEYCCDRIHFQPRAIINNVTRLNYSKAWVELELAANRYHLLSAPLKEMVTGDMFVPAEMAGIHSGDYFTDLDGASSPQNRFSPRIYQRRWLSSATERLRDTSSPYKELTDLQEIEGLTLTRWSRHFNHLSTPYEAWQGFSLWVDNEDLDPSTPFRFRFPKVHDTYDYFSDFDQSLIDGVSESIERSAEDTGRFIYEAKAEDGDKHFVLTRDDAEGQKLTLYDRWVYEATLPATVTLSATESTGHFLFGNPFMSPLSVELLLKENEGTISKVIFYDGNSTQSVALIDGALSGSVNVIAPMQSVMLEAANPSTTIDLNLTGAMIAPIVAPDARSYASALAVTLSAGELSTSLTIVGQTDFVSEALLDGEVAPRLALLAASEGRAFDIVPSSDRIPLTIIAPADEPLNLCVRAFNGFDRESYILLDGATGMEYPLDAEGGVSLPAGATSSGRFALVKARPAGIDLPAASDSGIYLSIEGNEMTVCGIAPGEIGRVTIHDLQGRLIAAYSGTAAACPITLPSGLSIVTVVPATSSPRSFKLLTR